MRATQHTPWSDVVELLRYPGGQDSEGYASATPAARTVFCTWEDGVSQSEFYLSEKTGHQAKAQVEVWSVDYQNEQFCRFGGQLYRVIRAPKASFDTTTLILEEVVR